MGGCGSDTSLLALYYTVAVTCELCRIYVKEHKPV